MFLYIENEEIKIKQEALIYPEVKALYNSDRTGEGKKFFQTCIKYMFYAYKKDGDFCNMFPKKRKELSAELAGIKWEELEANPRVQAMIDFYNTTQLSLTEKLYEGVKKDMESLLKSINDEPFVKEVQVEVEIDIPEAKDSNITVKYPIKTKIPFNNADNKMKLLKLSEALMDMEERLSKRIVKENMMKKGSTERMFDNKSVNK